MIYCTCGGQKRCFKCDGKGWIDEPGTHTADSSTPLPPVLKDYSSMPKSSTEKYDAGRKKPLISQVKEGGFSIPRSSSNMAALRLKARKLAKAARKSASPETPEKPEQSVAKEKRTAGIPRFKGIASERPAIGLRTDAQSSVLVEHERELAELIKVMTSTRDTMEQIELRILEKKRAIRKLKIKARRIQRT